MVPGRFFKWNFSKLIPCTAQTPQKHTELSRGFTLKSHDTNSLLAYQTWTTSKSRTGSFSSTGTDKEKKMFLSLKLFPKQQKFDYYFRKPSVSQTQKFRFFQLQTSSAFAAASAPYLNQTSSFTQIRNRPLSSFLWHSLVWFRDVRQQYPANTCHYWPVYNDDKTERAELCRHCCFFLPPLSSKLGSNHQRWQTLYSLKQGYRRMFSHLGFHVPWQGTEIFHQF